MLAVCRSFRLFHAKYTITTVYQEVGKRTIVTESIEPPPGSTIPERPCEVVLIQDPFYQTCWQGAFSQVLPNERGLHFCNISMDDCLSLAEGLSELQQDLSGLPNPVLIARGPLVSLVAQYYLESLPLAGLVLVDPILSSHKDALRKIEPVLDKSSAQYKFASSFLTGAETRPLKLEPGVVPLMIFHSLDHSLFQQAAHDVAFRLGDSDGTFGDVPVHDITPEQDKMVEIDFITEWIDDSVL